MYNAEIIAVGSELLLGGRLDTNSLALTNHLAALGVEVRFKSVVGDDTADIAEAVRVAARRVDVVILTGGLGPTVDDRTRDAVARVTGRPLRRRREALEAIRLRLAASGRSPTPGQLRQALIPAGAAVLANPVGTAPGFSLTWNHCFLAALPGVPAEAEQMFAKAVAPQLAALRPARLQGMRLEHRVLHTFGLPESEVDQRLRGLIRPGSRIRLGLLASPLGVSVSLTAWLPSTRRGHGSRHAVQRFERLVKAVRRRLGSSVYGEGDQTMEQVLGRALFERALKLAVAESCTGGLIGHRLTQVPGSSAYMDRVAVCYSNEAKQDMLGVPARLIRRYGAVSAEVAAAMARGIRLRSRAHIGLSVTGIAGPGGATERKPVGLVYVGLDGKGVPAGTITTGEHRLVREFRFHGDREAIKLRASQAALDLLRRWLAGAES